MTLRRFALLAGAASLLSLGACATKHDDDTAMADSPAAAAVDQPAPAAHASGDIVAVASGAGQFNTLVAAVQAAGLVEALQGPGPFTVFAPTDAAFAALPAGTVENLLRPENREQLRAILLYHVVPGRMTSAQLAGQTVTPTTLQGSTVDVDGRQGVKVDGATVVTADIAASNGVIHVIDRVIMP
jgi:uncharacterized surface protein with fasciclin (FAS1) repeats